MPAKHLIITGQVQGVFFRATTQEMAQSLGLTGWVKNTNEGAVEIHAEGSEDALQQLEEWCQHGPPAARVEKMTAAEVLEEGHTDFQIVHALL